MKNNSPYQKFKIIKKEEVALETFLFTLSGKLNFEPGQFVQVMVPRIGEATFAPCSSPYDKKKFELCIRATGNTTNRLVEYLPGEEMLIRGPYGKGWPEGALIGQNIVIIAGGMGIVPLRPLIEKLIKYQKEYKNIYLLAGFKTPEHLLFGKDFLQWKKKFGYIKIAVEKGASGWDGEVCMIPDIIKKLKIDAKNTKVLMCGPEVMFGYCQEKLDDKKILRRNIYISFERRMECGIGLCQHCNIGKFLVCKDGPVFRWDVIKSELDK
jgi:sulfhydrogenase subunit gamma (sulfur reductase)